MFGQSAAMPVTRRARAGLFVRRGPPSSAQIVLQTIPKRPWHAPNAPAGSSIQSSTRCLLGNASPWHFVNRDAEPQRANARTFNRANAGGQKSMNRGALVSAAPEITRDHLFHPSRSAAAPFRDESCAQVSQIGGQAMRAVGGSPSL